MGFCPIPCHSEGRSNREKMTVNAEAGCSRATAGPEGPGFILIPGSW